MIKSSIIRCKDSCNWALVRNSKSGIHKLEDIFIEYDTLIIHD